jgi:hypothetical protein
MIHTLREWYFQQAPRPLIFNKYFHGAGHSRSKAFVTRDSNSAIAGNTVAPRSDLFLQKS